MTSSLPPTAPLAILQSDHTGEVTSEERVCQSAQNGEWCRTQAPALMIHWDYVPLFPLKFVMAVVQWIKNPMAVAQVATEAPFWSTAWYSGLKDLMLLQLWCRLQLQLAMAQEFPGGAKKIKKLSWLIRILGADLGHESIFSLDCWLLFKVTCLSTDTCLSMIGFWAASSQTWVP